MSPMRVVKTACGLCHLACGMNVYVDGGRAVKVEGMREHPLNKGLLCPKGLSSIDYLYHPDRLKAPLKRVGESWVEVSWGEALDLIAGRLRRAIKEHGPRSIAGIIGMPILLGGQSTVSLVRRFYDAIGTPNVFSPESLCYRNQIVAQIVTMGKFCVPEPENAKCIVLWGSNPHASRPPWAARIGEGLRRGARLIVIDPRPIPLARRAELHLKPRPGTDAALALGMLNVIIEEELYDREFVDRWCYGFDRLRERVKQYTPRKVSEITWVPEDDIVRAARIYATTKPACIVQGVNALDQAASGFYTARAITMLQAVTGNIDVPGGYVRASRVHVAPTRLPERLVEKPLGASEYPLFYECWGRLFGEGQALALSRAILEGEPYRVVAVMVSASNPVLTWPNARRVREALESVDFLVVMDLFMTDTAELADVVLPACSFMERLELCDYYGTVNGVPYVMLRKEVVEPLWSSWPDMKFYMELARRMGYGDLFPWRDVVEYLNYVLRPTGLTLKLLLEEHPEGVPYGRVNYGEYLQAGFKTPTGRVELYSETLERLGYDPLVTHLEPEEGPIKSPKLAEEYPLILTTGSRLTWYLHSQLRNIDRLRRAEPEPTAEIGPETASRLGLSDGDYAFIETVRGRIKVRVRVLKGMLEGVVNVPHGWREANVNELTSDRPENPVVGYPSLKASLCRVVKEPPHEAS